MAESNDIATSNSTHSADSLIGILLSPMPDVDGDVDYFLLQTIVPLLDDTSCVCKIVPMLSLETIFEKAMDSGSRTVSFVYQALLAKVAQLPEYTKFILKRTDFWLQLYEKVIEKDFDYTFHMPISGTIERVLSYNKARHLHLIMEGKLLETMVVVASKAVDCGDNLATEKIVISIFHLATNCQCNEICMKYIEECGAFRFIDKNVFLDSINDYLKTVVISSEENSAREEFLKNVESVKCHKCGKKESNKRFKTCDRCYSVFYCCRKCHKSDQKKHKKNCRKLKTHSTESK